MSKYTISYIDDWHNALYTEFKKKKNNRMIMILSAVSNLNSMYTDVHSYSLMTMTIVMYIHFYLYIKLMLILNSYLGGCFEWIRKVVGEGEGMWR